MLLGYFDDAPEFSAAVGDESDQHLQAFFSAAIQGQPVNGVAVVALGANEAVFSLLFDRPQSLGSSFQRLASRLPGMAQSSAAPEPVRLQQTTLPDGSAAVGVPPGWRITFGQQGALDMEGPRGEQISLGAAAPVYTHPMPFGQDMFVAQCCDPVQAMLALQPQISVLQRRMGKPAPRILRVIESQPSPFPNGQAAYVLGELDEGGRSYMGYGFVATSKTGYDQFMYYVSSVVAPDEVFRSELPLMIEVWKSWSVSDAVLRGRLEHAIQTMNETWKIFRETMAESTRASLSEAKGWDQVIRGVETVEHAPSGKRWEVDNSKVNDLVDALNSSGTGHWRVVPPSELIPPK